MLFKLAFILFFQFQNLPCDRLWTIGDSLRFVGKKSEAKEYFRVATEQCPDSSEAFWRLGRSFLELSDEEYHKSGAGMTTEQKLKNFREGLRLTQKAISLQKNSSRAWEMKSTAYAAIISVSNLKTKAMMADSIRICAEESVRLNPKNDTSWHILGRWHYEVARLNWMLKFFSQFFFGGAPDGDYHRSEEYFRKAIDAEPSPANRFWLALALEAQGKNLAAKQEYERILMGSAIRYNTNDSLFVIKAKKKINQ